MFVNKSFRFLLHVSNDWGLARETLLLLYLVKLSSKMSQFKPEQFLLEPDKEIFYKFRKDDLISLGEYLELEVKSHMRKNEIQDVIISHLVSTKVFKESDVKSNEMMDTEIMKFKLKLEFRETEREREERDHEREIRIRTIEVWSSGIQSKCQFWCY